MNLTAAAHPPSAAHAHDTAPGPRPNGGSMRPPVREVRELPKRPRHITGTTVL